MMWVQKIIGEWWYKSKPEEINPANIYKLFMRILRIKAKGVRNYGKEKTG